MVRDQAETMWRFLFFIYLEPHLGIASWNRDKIFSAKSKDHPNVCVMKIRMATLGSRVVTPLSILSVLYVLYVLVLRAG